MTRKVKRNQITCRCFAYNFPHRQGGGKCAMPDYCKFLDDTEGECFHECHHTSDRSCPRIEWGMEQYADDYTEWMQFTQELRQG